MKSLETEINEFLIEDYKSEEILRDLKKLYWKLEKIKMDEISVFNKKIFSIKSKLFEKSEKQLEKYEKYVSQINSIIKNSEIEIYRIKSLTDFRKKRGLYYDYENLLDEKEFYHEKNIKLLKKYLKIIEKDFLEYGCVFFDLKSFWEKIEKIEKYCEIYSRILKIKNIASLKRDFDIVEYDYQDYLDEIDEEIK